jgi:thiol-disulfide isomerase/thioredoxin
MNSFARGAVCVILCLVIQTPYAQENDVSPEELAAFNVTLYAEPEAFPFDHISSLDGQRLDRSALAGKYLLVNLFATWCPYCEREKPSLQRLYRERAGERFTVLAVAVGERAETVTFYMKEHGYDFPAGVDVENKLRGEYAPRLPTSYILDGEGKILARIAGNKDWDGELARKVLGSLIPEGEGRL